MQHKGVIVAGALGALLVVTSPALAAGDPLPASVAEVLEDCKDDEIENGERSRLCSGLIGDSELPAAVRAEALVNRGIIHLSDGQTQQAMADFEMAIALQPSDPVAHAYRGEAHKAFGQIEKALSDYDTAISLDSASADLYANRGDIHRQLGAADKAKDDFESALRIERDHEIAIAGLQALTRK